MTAASAAEMTSTTVKLGERSSPPSGPRKRSAHRADTQLRQDVAHDMTLVLTLLRTSSVTSRGYRLPMQGVAIMFSDDARFHGHRADVEYAAAEAATCPASRDAHRRLADAHELAAYRAAREPSSFLLFDDDVFIRFAKIVSSSGSALSAAADPRAHTSFARAPHIGVGDLLR
jgi:hypothetical protein